MSILLELKKDTKLLKQLSKPLEEAVFCIALLRKASCADISSLKKRIQCQKVIYFANRLSLSPAYNFNMYIHGPYSPDLAKDLFTLESKFNKIEPVKFVLEENKEHFEKLTYLINSTCKDLRKLEIAATLDFFNQYLHHKAKATKKTIKLKAASEDELKDAKKHLALLGLW